MATVLSGKMLQATDETSRWLASRDFLFELLQEISQPFTISNSHGRMLLWNRALEEMSGYSSADLRDMQVQELISEETPGPSRSHPFSTLQDQGSPSSAAQLHTKDGQTIPVELSSVRLEFPGGEPLILTQTANVSDRRRLEAELRQAQKMEGIGRLAGGIAHDFNNVLTTILGLTESMMNGRTAPASESLREIHHAATHAAELTHSLLAFSRRQILQMKNIRLEAVIENITRMVGRLIGEDIRLEISIEKGLASIRADQSQLEQVLLNLCVNARDAMSKGGELHIGARMADLSEEWCRSHKGARPGRSVVLSVRDTGEGMDEETLRRVFEPFFTRKAPGKGTGLGLSMVYGIVKQHDAFITVNSTLGTGTEFTICFPPAHDAPEQASTKPAPISERGSATVLVVEDEKSVRRLVLEVLSNLGYRTFAAANGEEAVKVFERWSEQIDLVLLDAILPKKGSREVYDQIRARKPSVRFLFTSGYNEVFINQKFELDPSFDFLRKPFTTIELATRIRSALQ